MPTYEYLCTECGEPLEAVQSFTDDALTVCPACGGRLRKVFSAVGVVFKGSGFYRNDSRSENGKKGKTPAAASSDGKSSESNSSDSKSSDSKSSDSKSSDSTSSSTSSDSSSSGSSGSSATNGSSGGSGTKPAAPAASGSKPSSSTGAPSS